MVGDVGGNGDAGDATVWEMTERATPYTNYTRLEPVVMAAMQEIR
jgi:hypothetical protein